MTFIILITSNYNLIQRFQVLKVNHGQVFTNTKILNNFLTQLPIIHLPHHFPFSHHLMFNSVYLLIGNRNIKTSVKLVMIIISIEKDLQNMYVVITRQIFQVITEK